jgi:hypothetical protein
VKKLSLAKVEQWNLGLSVSAVAASGARAAPPVAARHFATSLAAGAFLEAVNLGALRRSALAFFEGRMSGSWQGTFALRFLGLGVAIFLSLHVGANPVALLIGMSIAMPAVLIDAWLNRPPILDAATLPVFLDDLEAGDASDEKRADRGGIEPDAARWAAGDERTTAISDLQILGALFRNRVTSQPSETLLASERLETPTSATPQSTPVDAAPDETSR